jgi:hypothetical protein
VFRTKHNCKLDYIMDHKPARSPSLFVPSIVNDLFSALNYPTSQSDERIVAIRIIPIQRTVPDIPVKIDIPAREADRVFGDEPSEIAVIPAGPVVMEPGEFVILAAREFVPGRKISRRVAE